MLTRQVEEKKDFNEKQQSAIQKMSENPALKKILEMSLRRNSASQMCGWGESDAWEHSDAYREHSYYVEG